jgi:hypothetical protein
MTEKVDPPVPQAAHWCYLSLFSKDVTSLVKFELKLVGAEEQLLARNFQQEQLEVL